MQSHRCTRSRQVHLATLAAAVAAAVADAVAGGAAGAAAAVVASAVVAVVYLFCTKYAELPRTRVNLNPRFQAKGANRKARKGS